MRAPIFALRTIGLFLAVFVTFVFCGDGVARADGNDAPAAFAIIIGSNTSVDAQLPPLKYADDDAARYQDLFRLLGARTYVLSRLDENTRRLHPQVAAEALEPRRADLERTINQVAIDVAQARDRHVDTALYFIYAGHGNVRDDGEGYVTLEDMRITGGDLAGMVAKIPATRVHVIVDACDSYFLAYSRGPGGERRPVHDFQHSAQLTNDPRVGLLLSTSSARESHEWDAYQSGVFSHEVRSGLYGAADADGDGRVSYREIAAFVARANAAIPNEKFRPDLHAKAPVASETLLDLRRGLTRRLDVDGAHAAHYWLEDEHGVRLLDFHNAAGETVHVVRPAPSGRIYMRRVDDDSELMVPATPDVVAIADLSSAPPRVASRGAAHEAFGQLFTLPFDETTVQTYVEPKDDSMLAPLAAPSHRDASSASSSRRVIGFSALGLGVAAVGTGVILSASAITISHDTSSPSTNQASVSERNNRVANLNTGAAIAYVGGGAAIATGLVVLFWPAARHVQVGATSSGAFVGYGNSF